MRPNEANERSEVFALLKLMCTSIALKRQLIQFPGDVGSRCVILPSCYSYGCGCRQIKHNNIFPP